METQTIILIVGIAMVFIGVFGGGFEIKEIKVPKVNAFSRSAGFLIGIVFLLVSQGIIPFLDNNPGSSTIPDADNSEKKDSTAIEQPVVDAVDTGVEALKQKLADAEEAWVNPTIESNLILSEYQTIKESAHYNDLNITDRGVIENRIKSLNNAARIIDALKNDKGSSTIQEKLKMLSVDFDAFSQKNKVYLIEQKNLYEDILNSQAHVTTSSNFVTCVDINRKNPVRITSSFRKGNVWVWMRIHSNRDESMKLKWVNLDKNDLIKTNSFRIRRNPDNGYRSYYSKNIQESGNYEARLYNQDGYLVAKKDFQVN